MPLPESAPSLQPTRRTFRAWACAVLGTRRWRPAWLSVWSVLGTVLCIGAQVSLASAQTVNARLAPQFRTASRPLITERVDPGKRLALPGAVHPDAAFAQDLGELEDAVPIEHIQLALRRTPERQAALDALVEAQNDPARPSFHQWLTPEQIGTEFGPATSDLTAIITYLQSEGFTVNGVSQSQIWIDFTGSAAVVKRSLHTGLHRFRTPAGGVYTSAAQSAELPAALLPAISGLVSLSNFPFHAQHRPVPSYANGAGQSVGAQDFYTIYNELPLLTAASPINGAGQTIALIEETNINTADVTAFRTLFGVSPAVPVLTVQHGSASVTCANPGITSTDEETEAVLDTEWAGAIAPGASLLVMTCAGTQSMQGVLLSVESVIDDNLAGTLSLSYGGTELGQSSMGSFISNLYEQAAAQGQTVVVSSGDSGSDVESDGSNLARHGLNVNVLSSSAYNISAGGTDFQDKYNQTIDGGTSFGVSAFWNAGNGPGQLTARSYVPETTWNETCASSLLDVAKEGRSAGPLALCEDANQRSGYLYPVAGSGGQSILNARPSWQTGTVYGLPSLSTYSGRLLPDVSLFASSGAWGHSLSFYQSDLNVPIGGAGGTSFVAPQLAGVFALIAQKTHARVGLANVELYNLAAQQFGVFSYSGSACNGSGASGTGETSSLPSASCLFYDIQTGNNSVACRSGSLNCYTDVGQIYGLLATLAATPLPAYTAGQGYDLATGIGSLNIQNLVNSWIFTPLLTSTTLALSQTTFPLNTSITFTSSVISASGLGTPTGTVELASYAVASVDASAVLSNGRTTGSTNTLPSGTYTVFAKYLGDEEFAPSFSPAVSVTVNPQATATTLSVTPSTGSVYSSFALLSATLSPVSLGMFHASSTISFFDGSTILCNAVSVDATTGIATCNTSALTVGTHTYTAVYAGDSNFAASTSPPVTLAVARATPKINVINMSYTYGTSSAALSASLFFSFGAAPTGALTFTVDGGQTVSALCAESTYPVICTATYAVASLAAGTHTITANLAADTNYTAASATGGLSIAGAAPVIYFAVPSQSYGSASITLAATSNSSGAFSYSVVSGPATINGPTVILTGIGRVVLAASEAAAGNYAAATQSATFTVAAASAVWLGNANGTLSTFSLLGAALSPNTGFSGGGLGTVAGPLGMAFDAAGHLWVANSAGGVSEFNNAGAAISANPYTVGGIHNPLALAVDGAGQIWIANGNASVSMLANTGCALSPATGFTGAGLSTPGGLAVDLSGNVWVANTADNSVTEILGVAAPVAPLATAVANGTTGARP